ncbi:MAG: translation initiation factor IF-2 [Clostridia bacterium]|nr:translation initiation factor IF-2 [Clostridia bacterium]
MSKLKVQEATKELSIGAGRLLEEVSNVRRAAQETMQMLRRLENAFVQEEEQRKEQQKIEAQRQILDSQSKAWTMPDAEEALEALETLEEPVEQAPQELSASDQPEKAVAKPSDEEAADLKATLPEEKEIKPAAAAKPAAPAVPVVTQFDPGVQSPGEGPRRQPQRPAQGRAFGQSPQGGPARPFGQSPQGGPARPFGQSPQGGPARPFGQSPQGGPARPFGQSPQGGAARPFGQAPQGGRPGMGGPAARPGGAPGRPGMGRNKGPELAPSMEKERVSNYDPNKRMYQRQHDPERQGRNRRQMIRETGRSMDDDVVRGGRKARRKISAQMMMEPIKIEKAFMTAETITVKDLTERIGKPAGEIIKKLLLLGTMATINQELDFDTAQLICSDFGVELELKLEKTAEDMLIEADTVIDTETELLPRPPVVTIMGHVDHGKTSLLDYIRKTRVTAGEAGGITQHIGAYTVSLQERQITFLDTPGHEAFTAMRARGTQATDIAILVVAADDGVMPQTIESINHCKAANVPMIVAINKIDKPTADIERIKQELTRHEVVAEDWGGDVIMSPVSATSGEGVGTLLENILLLADMQELRANPNRTARGVIIEARLDKGRGPVATVLVQTGTLRNGDTIVAGMAHGRVRAMIDDRGDRVKEAGPSMPVEIIGFNDVPAAGDEISAVEDERLSRLVAQERRDKQKMALTKSSARASLDELYSQIAEGRIENLNVIIKADVQGSVEAVRQALEKLSNEQVRVRTIHAGAGAINENDVMLANIDNAIIIGFNVRPDNKAREAAVRDNIDIRLYRVIYQAIEDVEKAMKGLLAPEFKEVLLGHAEVRNVFKVTGVGTVAGCYVTDGKLQRNAQVRLLRDNVVLYEGKLDSLKRFKDDAREVASGYECGAGLEKYNDIKEGDVIECFVMEEIAR